MESAEEDDSPYSQTCRRRDPVYLASMAAHALPTSQVCFFFRCLHIFTQYLCPVASSGHTQYFHRTHRALMFSSLIFAVNTFEKAHSGNGTAPPGTAKAAAGAAAKA